MKPTRGGPWAATAFGALLLTLSPGTATRAQVLPEPHQYVPESVEEYEWEEQEANIPPYPKEENLLEFQVDAADPRYRFFIDTDSISIGRRDGVVRYTLVLDIAGGNRTVSYEGIKCSSREYRTYAMGTREREMRPVTRIKWNDVRRSGRNLYRADLWEFYLCNDQALPKRDVEEILRSIRFPLVDRKDRGFGY